MRASIALSVQNGNGCVFDELALFVACLRSWASAVAEGKILFVCGYVALISCSCPLILQGLQCRGYPFTYFLDSVDVFFVS